jgi:serine/threonine-protein kinase
MAVVYLAEDLRHHRQVAIKVLLPELAATIGPDRFLREIDIAAALTHPHILPVHDSGEADGFLYYVMPYIEGQSLKARLAAEGELPIEDAVRIVTEVVDALAHAHEHGVVHRDIKPDNVMLSGRHALVMDFGVAKAVSEASEPGELTTAGVAIGTPTYMSPEQAVAASHIDHRADIYSVGVLAYELLAGRTPFVGASQRVLAAHVTEKPEPVTAYREAVSPALAHLVMRCLEKKPADRWQGAQELLPQLEAVVTPSVGLTPTETAPVEAVSAGRRRIVPAAIGAVALAALIVAAGMWMLRDDPLTITTSNITRVTIEPGVEFQPALSPDGSEVAYVKGPIPDPRIVVRSTIDIGSGGGIRLADGVPGDHKYPSWSSDGASVRFYACLREGECDWKQVGKLGGPPRAISAPIQSDRLAWSRDGSRVAFAVGDSIFAYSSEDAEPRLLGVHLVDPWAPHSLAWSPDDRSIVYVNGNIAWKNSGNVSSSSIWMIAADGGEPIRVTDEVDMNLSPQWLPDSRHIVFISDRDGPRGIYVVEVSADGPRGDPRPVPGAADAHSISMSADGRKLAYAKFTIAQNIWSIPIPRSGVVSINEASPVTAGNRVIESHSLSPDQEWIVFDSSIRWNMDIYKMPIDGGTPQMIADLPMDAYDPDWSPDGTEVAFGSGISRAGKPQVWVVPADGGTPVQLTDFPGFDTYADWSPDGLHIAYMSQGPQGTEWGVWILSRDTVGGTWSAPTRLIDFYCRQPDWAPDGASIACQVGDRNEIVRVSRGGEELSRFQMANLARARKLKFSDDGSTIYFIGTESDGSQGVWSIPTVGGEPAKVVAFDDPELSAFGTLTAGRDRFYLTLSEYESDIWVMDLEW